MPEIHNKAIHSFSSEDPNFPARNLLEVKVTKKWKCKEVGEKSCFVVLKLDQPRVISGIDIGNEYSGFIEVLVADSKQDPPEFKEILLATSFMTIVEAKNGTNPHRVRCFGKEVLIESVAKQKWDLVKIFCTQPFTNRLKYGLSFVTLHTPEEIKNEDSPVKPAVKKSVEDSGEKKMKFGKFTIRKNSDSDSEDDKKDSSPFNRWKNSKSSQENKVVTVKEQMKAKIEENRKRIRKMTDSSEEEEKIVKKPPKLNRNRMTGLVYEDEDDEPNEKLQKKLDKDKEKAKEQKKDPKLLVQREKSPTSKFSSFISDDPPSTSKEKSNRPSFSSSDKKKSPRKEKSPQKPVPAKLPAPSKTVTYKPFDKLLDGVVFAFSGFVNPERGILRQKALDMGAKYRGDWDRSCTHLICAFSNTPKYREVKGKGKIVTKKWIENCFSEQKKLPWRRFALDDDDKDEPESDEEIHNVLAKKEEKHSESGSDDDMVVVDKRINLNGSKKEEEKTEVKKLEEKSSLDVMEVSTDDDLMGSSGVDLTQIENQVYKGKTFYLHDDLSATDVIKLKNQITSMSGKLTENLSKANYIITATGRNLSKELQGEMLTSLWVFECHEMEAFIPTTRYKPKSI